jgi:diadenosine tetraphosphatase ApaH/serine/threonine PP2A family protein phosphatase
VIEGDFNPDAGAAGRWTIEALDEPSRAFLAGLRPEARVDGAELFHASARDPVWEYVLGGESALATLELTTAPLVLVGHSHVPFSISLEGHDLAGAHAPGGTEIDLVPGRRLCNPGSVGQPRDGDPHAAWLLLDLGQERAVFRRVEYDVEATQAEIRDAGLPESLAERLTLGV